MPVSKPPRKYSERWNRSEMERFKKLSREHNGLTPPAFAALILGVSRQRVHQLMTIGRLTSHDIHGRVWLAVDEVEMFATLERSSGFRYAEVAA